MGDVTRISWTDRTMNAWIGCNEVGDDAECVNCYARELAHNRMGFNGLEKDLFRPIVWGSPLETDRWRTAAATWNKLLKWEKEAVTEGRRLRVFSFSLADWAEYDPLHRLDVWRADLWRLYAETSNLDHQLLTKRPMNVLSMVPAEWRQHWPRQYWIGTSIGVRTFLDVRMRAMEKIKAAGVPTLFLSCEPLTEDIANDLEPYLRAGIVQWLITGGESGAQHRPWDDRWALNLRDLCLKYGVAYFHKQGGGRLPGQNVELEGVIWHQFPDSGLPLHQTPPETRQHALARWHATHAAGTGTVALRGAASALVTP